MFSQEPNNVDNKNNDKDNNDDPSTAFSNHCP